jgi:AAA domain-containing protein/DnaB helicase-like protein/helix-turn-helix protein
MNRTTLPSPPQNIEAEESVLAAMLLGSEAIERARALLAPADFFRAGHAKVFAALLAISDRGERADSITLAAELRSREDLAVVGGAAGIARILEFATTTANLEEHARLIRAAARRRDVRDVALAVLEKCGDPAASDEGLRGALDRGLDALNASSPSAGGRFTEAAIGACDLAALDIPKPRSLIGDGVLVAGGFAILYGKPGLGKSWLALGVARSLARGESWMGLATAPEGVRVGVLQLELGAFAMKARLHTLGIGQHERDESVRVVCRPRLRGVVDLFRQSGDLTALRQWIADAQLDVLIIDALSRAHTANENKAEELGQVLAALDAIRHETGCALLLVHHEPKERDGSRPDNHLDALRGTSRLQSDPTLLVRVYQSRGLRCLTFAKVSEGPTPGDVWFRIGEDGQPEAIESPDARGDKNREMVLRLVVEAGTPLARGEIAERAGLTPATAKRHLAALVESGLVMAFGENRHTRYLSPTGSPAQPAHDGGRAGSSGLFDKDIAPEWVATGSSGQMLTGSPAQPALPTGERAGEPVSQSGPPASRSPDESSQGDSDA